MNTQDYICRNDRNKETKVFTDWHLATSFVNALNDSVSEVETGTIQTDSPCWWVEAN